MSTISFSHTHTLSLSHSLSLSFSHSLNVSRSTCPSVHLSLSASQSIYKCVPASIHWSANRYRYMVVVHVSSAICSECDDSGVWCLIHVRFHSEGIETTNYTVSFVLERSKDLHKWKCMGWCSIRRSASVLSFFPSHTYLFPGKRDKE